MLALAGLQSFGAVRGYLCDCAADVRIVSASRCDQGSCHPGAAHHGHHHDGHSAGDDHSHDHHALREGVDAAGNANLPKANPPGEDTASLPALTELPARQFSVPPSLVGFDPSPPPRLVVARCVVRQV